MDYFPEDPERIFGKINFAKSCQKEALISLTTVAQRIYN
jgi:hypothetical protein